MLSSPSDFEHPAFTHIPSWVQQKLSSKAIDLVKRVHEWVETECLPAEPIFKAQLERHGRWNTPPIMKELRAKAKKEGLWNLFLPKSFGDLSPGLTNLEYSVCAEIMGRVYWAAMTMNCHAPDTGNMELMAKYCNEEQKEKWLMPVLRGECFSAYSMTEPDRASSDATNINCRITRDPEDPNYLIINGRKLYGNCIWQEGLGFYILMACSDPENPDPWKRHTTVIVPSNTPGFKMVRNLTVFGYDWAPDGHGEFLYENARIPAANIILGEGKAFEIAQGRLGPGRIHHCMRLIGQTERAYELAVIRATDDRKKPRGKLIGEFDSNIERIASMRLQLDAMRLVVMSAADTMDNKGNKAGRYAIAQSKILVPKTCAEIIDECMQLYGGQGVTQLTPLAVRFAEHKLSRVEWSEAFANSSMAQQEMWQYARIVRIADGPDAAHRHQVGRDELKTAPRLKEQHARYQQNYKQLCERWDVKYEIS